MILPVANRRQAMSFYACLSMLYLPPRLCRHISLYLRTKPHMESASARCEPFSVFLLLPGASTCPAWLSAAPVASRCEPFSPNRLTPASRDRPGAMAVGDREQVASCGAFVLIMRRPASDAPLKRGICFSKIRGFKVADYKLNRILRPLKVFHRNPAENSYI